jgi:hypothetical protein
VVVKKIQGKIKSLGILLAFIASIVAINLLSSPLSVAAETLVPSYRYTDAQAAADNSNSASTSVTTDSTGATYAAGSFMGTVNFAGSSGNDSATTQHQAMYITKHNLDGSYAWTRTIDMSNDSSVTIVTPSGVATDSNNDVYLAGNFRGNVVYDGPGGDHSQITGPYNVGTFITKYSSNGTYLWTQTILAPPTTTSIEANAVAVDASGNVYLAGNFAGGEYDTTMNFDQTGGGTDYHTDPNGSEESFLTKFSASGSYDWTQTSETTNGFANIQGVAIDPSGDVYVTGNFSETVNFAGASGNDTQTDPSGNGSVFLTKFSTSGTDEGTKVFISSSTPTSSASLSTGIAIDANGNVYISGNYTGAVNFAGASGNDTQTDPNTVQEDDAFLTKFSASGSYDWTQSYPVASGDSAASDGVTTDQDGNIYTLTDTGGNGIITRYDANGNTIWNVSFDTTNGFALLSNSSSAYGGAITADTFGNVDLASVFSGTVGFDGTGGSDIQTASGDGSAFLTSYKTIPTNSLTSGITSPLKPPLTGYGVKVPHNFLLVFGFLLMGIGFVTVAFRFRPYVRYRAG